MLCWRGRIATFFPVDMIPKSIFQVPLVGPEEGIGMRTWRARNIHELLYELPLRDVPCMVILTRLVMIA